jgi:hypothetical protein
MTLDEMLPNLQTLPRADKLRLIQFLAADLAQEEVGPSLVEGARYPIWSPFNSHEAAAILLRELEAHGESQ